MIIWQVAARRKLSQILAFISAESPAAARKYTDELFERTNGILEFPDIGGIYSVNGEIVVRRIIIDKTKSVLYRSAKGKIFILDIHDNRLDWK